VSKTRTEKTSPSNGEFMFGTDAFKNGFEKTAKFCESAGEFNKRTFEAYIESATVLGKGIQSVAQGSSTYAKDVITEAMAASKAVMASKSITEMIELQTSFTKSVFTNYLRRLSQINEAFAATAKESAAPLQARAEAAADLMKVVRA
jgi:phasin family protein